MAHQYAELGGAGFPLHWPTSGGCSCRHLDCGSVGKHPIVTHGLKEASSNSAQIASWWRRWPSANVGIVTGAISGIVVLDVDPRHGGNEALAALEAERELLPATVHAITGSTWKGRSFRD